MNRFIKVKIYPYLARAFPGLAVGFLALLLSGPVAAAAIVPCDFLPYLGEPIDGQSECLAMEASGETFHGLLRQGDNKTGVVMIHGRNNRFAGGAWRNSPIGPVVNPLRQHLSDLGYSTFSIESPGIPSTEDANGNGRADFGEYLANEEAVTGRAFARINTAITELETTGVERIILLGFSQGARLVTAATAAAQNEVLGNSLDVVGLINVGTPIGQLSTPATTGPNDIKGFSVIANLTLIQSIPILDLYGDQDPSAVPEADLRKNAYEGAASAYTQTTLTCPDFTSNSYFFPGMAR